ncbi:MAG: hypothetical protein ACM3XO_18235 [Bacteroidota bacterium]
MRNLIFLLIMSLTFVMGGCATAPDTPLAASATPNILPRLDPSPTPSGSTLPLTCQVTDLKVYVNERDGYCFAYPTRFTLGDQPAGNPEILGPAVDDSHEPIHARLNVEVEPVQADMTLREQAESYLKKFSVFDPATFTWSQVTVGGEPGWMVEPVTAMLAYRIVFIQHRGNIYRLLFWPVDIPHAQADLDDLTQTMLGSFSFTR